MSGFREHFKYFISKKLNKKKDILCLFLYNYYKSGHKCISRMNKVYTKACKMVKVIFTNT